MKALRNIAVGAMIIALLTLIPPQWGRVGRWLLLGIFTLCVAGAAIKLLLRHQARIASICTSLGKLVPKVPSFKWTGTPMGVIRYAAIIPLVVLAIVMLANWPLDLGRAQDIPWWVLPAAWLALVVLTVYFLVPNEGGKGVKIRAKVAQWCAVVIIAATIHAWWERPRPWLPSHFIQIPRPIMAAAENRIDELQNNQPTKGGWRIVLGNSRPIPEHQNKVPTGRFIERQTLQFEMEDFSSALKEESFVCGCGFGQMELRLRRVKSGHLTGTLANLREPGEFPITIEFVPPLGKWQGWWYDTDNNRGSVEIFYLP